MGQKTIHIANSHWSAKKRRSKTHLLSLSCALQRLHHLAFIQYWVKSGKYCARAAWVRTTSGGKTDENIIQINKFCITKVFLPVVSDRHQYFLPVTFWNYLKSTDRQATFRSLDTDQRIACFDSCQLTITWMPKIKDVAMVIGGATLLFFKVLA